MMRWRKIGTGLAACMLAGAALAQGYPAKPVRLVVLFPLIVAVFHLSVWLVLVFRHQKD